MSIETLYVAPAVTDHGTQCRIYAMPYPMRPGQKPSDIHWKYQRDWKEIGLMNSRGKLVCCEPAYRRHLEALDLYGGLFVEIERDN